MFRQIAANIDQSNVNGANVLFNLHPVQLMTLLEVAWETRVKNPNLPLGHPDHRSDLASFPPSILNTLQRVQEQGNTVWDHLIYAYMIENTRIYEIFRRVLHESLHGEKLGTPLVNASQDSQAWLRTTEELFYRDPPPFSITTITSYIRPDLGSSRRNAYQRMFGMDLNHGHADTKPYSYHKAEVANNEFVATFEEFLREVWVGMIYVSATSSSNPTDTNKIAELAEKLHDMLRSRRQNGNLSREEFVSIAMMSWFHLTLQFDSAIVQSLRAEATGVEQRLFKIAERVGLPAHGLSKNFFDIADSISKILITIETGIFNSVGAVPALYTPAPGGSEADMRNIITHWSVITGRDIKARRVSAT
jgi:transcriptional regulator with XRE-family HTH domain